METSDLFYDALQRSWLWKIFAQRWFGVQVMPIENSNANTNKMYDLVMDPKKWGYGNANLPNVYYDEINRMAIAWYKKSRS